MFGGERRWGVMRAVHDTPKINVVARNFSGPKWPLAEDPIHLLLLER